jgi:hypothetical protein
VLVRVFVRVFTRVFRRVFVLLFTVLFARVFVRVNCNNITIGYFHNQLKPLWLLKLIVILLQLAHGQYKLKYIIVNIML